MSEHERKAGEVVGVDAATATDDPTMIGRREAAKKMGKFLAYTAPAMLALLTAKNSAAAS